MRALNCDICGKDLEGTVKGRDYWHIREFDVCENCKESMDSRLKPVVRKHFPYSQDWYEHEFVSLLEKCVASGRV